MSEILSDQELRQAMEIVFHGLPRGDNRWGCISAQEAIIASHRSLQATQLVWSDVDPTEPGDYWFRSDKKSKAPSIVYVNYKLRVYVDGDYVKTVGELRSEFIYCQWARISEPRER